MQAAAAVAAQDVLDIAVISAEQAKTIETVMRPFLLVETLAMLARIPLTWYPQVDGGGGCCCCCCCCCCCFSIFSFATIAVALLFS